MSRYQMFQEWWSRATSGPSDFRIDKRSAEIGFDAALDISEKNFTAHNNAREAYRLLQAIHSEPDVFLGTNLRLGVAEYLRDTPPVA